MPSAAPISPAAGGSASLDARFAAQRDAFAREPYPTLRVRRDRVARLRALVRDEVARLCDAVDADFGRRPAQETRLAELHVVAAEARHALRALPRWMHRERVATPWHLQPAHAFVMRQPVGVAGIVSPWNYPVQLALAPAVAALAGLLFLHEHLRPRAWVAIALVVVASAGAAGHRRPATPVTPA